MQRKLFKIPTDETDSQEFIDIVNLICTSVTRIEGVNYISITKIKNWFDHKWLNYSGKAVIPFESGGVLPVDAALEPRWRQKITVPPFNPKRVVWERSYFVDGQVDEKLLQTQHGYQQSDMNLQNRIKDKVEKGLFVWFSSNSELNSRGSLMIYNVDFGKVETWYASLVKKDNWEVFKTKGIARKKIIEKMRHGV